MATARNRRGRYGLVVFGVVLALIAVGGFGLAAATAGSRPATERYTTASVTKATVQETLALTGTVTRTGEEPVAFTVSGTVTSVKVRIGDTVKAGQVLATVDSAPARVAVLQARAGLARAEAQLKADQDSIAAAAEAKAKAAAAAAKARKAAARSRAALMAMQKAMVAVQRALGAQQKACLPVLSPQAQATPEQLVACSTAMAALAKAQATASGAIMAASVPSGQSSAGASVGNTVGATDAQLASDAAAVLDAQQRVNSAEDDLAATTLRTPHDGVVGALTLTKGAASTGGSVTVVGAGRAVVSVEVPLSVRPLVDPKQQATVTPAGTAATLTGTVQRVSVLATDGTSGATASYTTTITVADPDQKLHTGAKAEVSIELRQVSDVLTVPVSATTRVTSSTATVRVLADPAATPETVTVTTGAVGQGRIQVVQGLTEGQRVVLADRQEAVPAGNFFGRRTTPSASATPLSSTQASAAPTSPGPAAPSPSTTR